MVLLLKEPDVDALLDMKTTVACLEAAFREQSEGRTILPERQVIQTSTVVRIMAASAEQIKAIGLKALLGTPAKRKPQATYFVTLLFDPEDAHLLAVISAGRLTQLRTGGASAVATRYLARPRTTTLGVVGAGVQGFGQLEGIASVCKLKSGFVFDLDESRAKNLVEKAKTKFGIELRHTSRIEDLYEVDVLCTATTSLKPLLFGHLLRPGTHVNAVGSNAPNRQELDESTLLRAKVFLDHKEQALKESGDLMIPIRHGSYKPQNIAGEICDVITGKVNGRTSDTDVTLFKSVGFALEDIAVARTTYDIAISRGIGIELDFQS